jgi:hypothetical protein
MALTAFSLVLSKGPRWFLPVLAAQSLLLVAVGERSPVTTNAIVLIVLLSHVGQKPSARHLRTAGALTVLVVLAIGGVRAQQGRSLYYRDSGLSTRAAALAAGLGSVGTSYGLLTEAAVRLDGTSFAAAVLQSVSHGQPRLPGFAGMYAGFLSPPWLIAFLAAVGGLAGWGERWGLGRIHPRVSSCWRAR